MHQRTLTMHAQHLPCLHGIDSDTSYSYLASPCIHNFYNVVFFKLSFDGSNSYRKDTDGFLSFYSLYCQVVQVQFAFGKPFAVGNPFLYTRHDFGRRNETGTDCLSGMLQQIEQDVFLFPLAMMTVMPSSATFRAMVVLVSMPPLPKPDFSV